MIWQNKYIIWGAGFRGTKLLSLLTNDRVVAFIDNDLSKVGTEISGVPIIDFQTYVNLYQNLFIIISVVDYEVVERFLIKNKVFQYFVLSECPSEFKGYGIDQLERLLDFSVNNVKNNVIVGSNLYSCLLYEKMKADGVCNLYCYPNEGRTLETIHKMKELLNINIILELGDIIRGKGNAFITTREQKNIDIIQALGLECINAQDFSFIIKEYYNPILAAFKNKHLGKRCFIVATGSSLRKEDLDVLLQNKEICFSMNRIFQLENSNWLPDYYVAVDTMFLKNYMTEILNFPVNVKFVGESIIADEQQEGIYKIHCVTDDIFEELPEFSEDITYTVYGGATVTYACIQIAVYMGFKEIYLVGVDCNYNIGSKNNYFFKEKKEDYMNHETDRMLMSYQSAKKYADAHDIKIYNATRGGMLEVFERVDFDSLYEDKE